MTETQLERLTRLGERIRRDHALAEERLKRSMQAWEARQTEADRRFSAWVERRSGSRPEMIGVAPAAALLRIPVEALLADTRGQRFRIDFGRSHTGEPITIFKRCELERFARALLHRRQRHQAQYAA